MLNGIRIGWNNSGGIYETRIDPAEIEEIRQTLKRDWNDNDLERMNMIYDKS